MLEPKKQSIRRARDVVYVTPKSSTRYQILMEKIMIGVYWYEDANGIIQIDEESMRKEFENELEQVIFLANCEP